MPCKKGTPRAEYDAVVTSHLEAAGCEMLLLIGFMRIVSPEFCSRWDHRALNVHPSLLPAHAGGMDLEVHQAVVDAKEASSGCTVHFVEAEVDGAEDKELEASNSAVAAFATILFAGARFYFQPRIFNPLFSTGNNYVRSKSIHFHFAAG